MAEKKWRTVLVGFGNVGDKLSEDQRMRAHFAHASHAQVLDAHPAFDWQAVVDPSSEAQARAVNKYDISHLCSDIGELPQDWLPEVAVIATPPGNRQAIVAALPGLKGAMVEKPIRGLTGGDAGFVDYCATRDITVQVNFLRRGDQFCQSLAAGELHRLVGEPQAVFMIYGGGMFNIASHLVDLVRLLFGEAAEVQALGPPHSGPNDGRPDDPNIPFSLRMNSGLTVTAQTIDFTSYREAGIDIWGSIGRLSLFQEGLGISHFRKTANRGLENAFEIDSGTAETIQPTIGHSMYRMYDNLAAALDGSDILWSPASSACRTEAILDAVRMSAATDMKRIPLPPVT